MWLRTITARRIADFHRRRAATTVPIDDVTGVAPADGEVELNDVVERVLARLNAEHRRVVELVVLAGPRRGGRSTASASPTSTRSPRASGAPCGRSSTPDDRRATSYWPSSSPRTARGGVADPSAYLARASTRRRARGAVRAARRLPRPRAAPGVRPRGVRASRPRGARGRRLSTGLCTARRARGRRCCPGCVTAPGCGASRSGHPAGRRTRPARPRGEGRRPTTTRWSRARSRRGRLASACWRPWASIVGESADGAAPRRCERRAASRPAARRSGVRAHRRRRRRAGRSGDAGRAWPRRPSATRSTSCSRRGLTARLAAAARVAARPRVGRGTRIARSRQWPV